MNPSKDVEYPVQAGLQDEPVEPSLEEDPDSETPAEHALDKKAVLRHPDAKNAPHPLDRPKDNDFDEPDDLGVDVV